MIESKASAIPPKPIKLTPTPLYPTHPPMALAITLWHVSKALLFIRQKAERENGPTHRDTACLMLLNSNTLELTKVFLKTLYISADGHGMAGEDKNQED